MANIKHQQGRALTTEESLMSKNEYRFYLLKKAAESIEISEALNDLIADEDRLYPLLSDEINEWQSELN